MQEAAREYSEYVAKPELRSFVENVLDSAEIGLGLKAQFEPQIAEIALRDIRRVCRRYLRQLGGVRC